MVKRKIVVLLFIFCFCFIFQAWAVSLKDAQQDYLSTDYEAAMAKARRLRENDETLYFLGLVCTKIADYQRARIYLRKLINRFPESDFHDLAMMKIADTYFLEKDYQNAKELYQAIEERCLGLENKPLLFLRQAQIASRQGDWEGRKKYIKLIKEKYSRSPEMKFIETLESYGDFFTIQVGAFSQKGNSIALRNELSKEHKAYVVESKSGAYSVYKVRVGKFKKRYDAEKLSKQLRSQGYPAKIFP